MNEQAIESIRERLGADEGRRYWQTLEELAGSPEVQEILEQEFPSQRERFSDPVQRRDFLRLMGASLAILGTWWSARVYTRRAR